MRYLERERDHNYITLITVYCCDCSFIIAANVLVYLIYKVNFVIGMCV